jgi:hypothetical protein
MILVNPANSAMLNSTGSPGASALPSFRPVRLAPQRELRAEQNPSPVRFIIIIIIQ